MHGRWNLKIAFSQNFFCIQQEFFYLKPNNLHGKRHSNGITACQKHSYLNKLAVYWQHINVNAVAYRKSTQNVIIAYAKFNPIWNH